MLCMCVAAQASGRATVARRYDVVESRSIDRVDERVSVCKKGERALCVARVVSVEDEHARKASRRWCENLFTAVVDPADRKPDDQNHGFNAG